MASRDLTRLHPSSPALTRRAQLFRALSDETRLAILARLRHGEQCVCELMQALDAAQSRLSFHLRTLKEAGLVTDRRSGRWTYYAIEPGALAALKEELEALQPVVQRSG